MLQPSFHLLLLQQTICEFLADEGFVSGETLKIWKGDADLRVVPMLKTYCAQWWLNFVFMNSEGQKSWRSHDFIFVPTEPTI